MFRQPNNYSCGVYALQYLLYKTHIFLIPSERDLGTTKKDGTEPEKICAYLKKNGVRHSAHYMADPAILVNGNWQPPFMVLYQWGGDGHYGVVMKTDNIIGIFNPYTARIDNYPLEKFIKRWYSNRYGEQWALRILEAR